ncbi:hypothetical protein PsorP6_003975 [Peronosclerospora sorghi]|uniref:Uncharacterized protein n=1 Tax=Peronosclerospora sorghi TaxID=230839 RepID=A0ACC0VLB3_9STRA|nr:hypothetical protein PsorP6_003975 [Peronosclerospora sorghi]
MAQPQPVTVPPTFKLLLPFIRRAEELDRDTSRPESKLIAYFCRQHAMELGIKLRENDASNEATDYLLSLMDRLEDEKNKLPEFTQEEGKEICEDFAMEIFSKADDEDRAGMATKSTARTFYAAGTFFDILNQFGDLSEDIAEKRRYCKYKAATILKAIKEGNTPTPGPPDTLINDENASDDATATASTLSTFNNSSAKPLETTPLPSLTESVRSAGAMSASELDSSRHRTPSSGTSSPVVAPSCRTPASPYSAPKVPESTYESSLPQAPAHQPRAASSTAAYQRPRTPSPAHQLPSVSSHSNEFSSNRTPNAPLSQTEVNDAIEYAKFAIAALKVRTYF